MVFIGLDIGSSSIKGAILDLDEIEVGQTAHVPCPPPVPGLSPAHFELEPLAVVKCVEHVLSELLAGGGECRGIVSCGQMGGVVLADEAGNPLSNYLSWRDQRALEPHPTGAGSYFDVLRSRLSPQQWQQLGGECKAGAAPALLFWLAEQHRLPQTAVPLSLSDFVLMRLCGAPPSTEYTNALGAIHLESRDWHRGVLERLGIDRLRWPALCGTSRPHGHLSFQGRSIPCYPAVGDHQCALAGALLEDDELSINISTGSQVSLLAARYQPGDYQIRPYLDHRYLRTITHLPAGRSLNLLVELLREMAAAGNGIPEDQDPWDYISSQAAAAPDTELEVDLAFFEGPMGNRGNIRNITLENLRVGTLFRAALANMVDNYHQCARRLSPDPPGEAWKQVVVSGGLPKRLPLLRQMLGEKFACPLRMSPSQEETFLGLIALGLVASGLAADLSDASRLIREVTG